jgi:tRNA(adenine34) deaminase
MRLAMAASRDARERGDMPIGAALASPAGQTLWVARNDQVGTGDCTGHAEVALVHEAATALGAAAVRGATVYASGEPGALCSGAMFCAGVRRIVFAIPTADMAGAPGGP